jgi:hypothetical protein
MRYIEMRLNKLSSNKGVKPIPWSEWNLQSRCKKEISPPAVTTREKRNALNEDPLAII